MKKINYILDKNNYITSYTVIPFDKNKPYIELEDVKLITVNKTRIIDGMLDNTGEGNATYQKRLARKNQEPLRKELREIQKWLADNDWKVNKIVIGEWATYDERWLNYLSERQAKRTRQDELLVLLNN